jgi:glycosyltransferase involved in cell wall biosynthesis
MKDIAGHAAAAQIKPDVLKHGARYVAIIPALNEAECIGRVVTRLRALKRSDGTDTFAAVVVGDNGSSDATCEVAQASGAVVAKAQERGYGHGCMAAICAAESSLAPDVYVFVDGDDTLNYAEIESLLVAVERGAVLAIGQRVYRARHSMSLAQRFGNALCCALIRVLWRADVTDLGPLRAIRGHHFALLDMQALTYGWTLEMQIKAHERRLSVVEVPVSTLPRANGASKVSGNLRAAARCGRVMLRTILELWLTRRSRVTQSGELPEPARPATVRPTTVPALSPALRHLSSPTAINQEPIP